MENIIDKDIVLIPLTDADINIFINWLNKDYIYKWFCPDGETEKKAWIDEIKKRNNEYRHYNHFIVNYKNIKIGFCIYFDIYFEQEYSKEIYKKTFEKNHAFEIGFCIGEEKYLNKGIGKIIVKKLEEKILEIGGKEILADPDEKNIVSIKTLLSNGFIKIKDGDYRKKII
jgi:RimJ/RimL family protein N-acetyltransferase